MEIKTHEYRQKKFHLSPPWKVSVFEVILDQNNSESWHFLHSEDNLTKPLSWLPLRNNDNDTWKMSQALCCKEIILNK